MADGQPRTKITQIVTINAAIQFVTSVAKFAFIVPIVSSLGQLKWLWYKDGAQPLTDFQLYDSAGSGGALATFGHLDVALVVIGCSPLFKMFQSLEVPSRAKRLSIATVVSKVVVEHS